MLWNLVYDFYLTHIFGGYGSNNVGVNAFLGRGYLATDLQYTRTVDITVFNKTITLGNYLCLVSTAITVVFILVLCSLFVWKIIKLVGGLITR